MGILIPVEEEYGCRLWFWRYPGTEEELIGDWKQGKSPNNFLNPSWGDYSGTMTEVGIDEFYEAWEKARIKAHVHMDEDTYLIRDEEVISGPSYCPCDHCFSD